MFQYAPDVTFHKAFIVINSSETLFRQKTKSFPTCFGPCCDIDQTVEGRLTPAPPKKVVVVDWHETLGIDGRVAAENEAALEKLLEQCEVHIVSYVESYRWQKQLWDDVLELKCSSLLAGVHCCWRPDVTLQMLCVLEVGVCNVLGNLFYISVYAYIKRWTSRKKLWGIACYPCYSCEVEELVLKMLDAPIAVASWPLQSWEPKGPDPPSATPPRNSRPY